MVFAPPTPVVEQTLPPSTDTIARFKAALPGVFPRVLARSILIVRRKRWSRDGTIPEGNEAQDLLHEAIRRVLDGRRHWDPERVPDLEVFLEGVIRSLASDLARGLANRTDDIEKFTESKKPQLPDVLQCTRTVEIEKIQAERYQQTADALMEAACQEPVLEKIVQALMDGCSKPEVIAQETGLAVKEVYAGMKKIRRRLASAAKRRAL